MSSVHDVGSQQQEVADPPDGSGANRPQRLIGVDVARGAALLGMMAVHSFDTLTENDTPTAAIQLAGGRSAATFVLVAGASLAFVSGVRRPIRGVDRKAAAAGIAVRALCIALIGLLLGHLDVPADNILVQYGVLFALAIPLIWLRPRALAAITATLIVVAPLLLLATYRLYETYDLDVLSEPDADPSFSSFVHPDHLLAELFLTGGYPIPVFLAYLVAGLAIGRLNLRSTRVAWWLFGGGLALALTSWYTSSLLLFHFGGLEHLRELTDAESDAAVLWEPGPSPNTSWWWLALRAAQMGTPLSMGLELGAAIAVLGAMLLAVRIAVVERVLWPVTAAGSMTLTLYTAHLLVLAAVGEETLYDNSVGLYLLMASGALVFAVLWRQTRAQGRLSRWSPGPRARPAAQSPAASRRGRSTAAHAAGEVPTRGTATARLRRFGSVPGLGGVAAFGAAVLRVLPLAVLALARLLGLSFFPRLCLFGLHRSSVSWGSADSNPGARAEPPRCSSPSRP